MPSRGAGMTLVVTTTDARKEQLIGYRDPADPSTAITAAPQMMPNLQAALEKAYADLGYELLGRGADADVTLEVRLVELEYAIDKPAVRYSLRTAPH